MRSLQKRSLRYAINKIVVFNFLGHLVQPATPEDYNEKYVKWNMTDLPIIPNPFQ